ncbi:MAG: TolC family protein, partial [Gemmatimonadota bacterium]
MRATLLPAAVVLTLGTAALPALAQTSDTTVLSLDRALEIAGASNPAYRQAENNTDLNAVEMRQAWASRILPQASLTLFNTAYTGNIQHRATDFYGNPVENPRSEWVYFSSTQQGLNLNWQIQGASLFQAHRRQSLVNRDRDVAADQARLTMSIGVRRRYMDALEQRDLLREEEALADARQVDLEVAQRLFSLAMRTRVDVLNAELGIQQQSLAAQQQRAAYEKAKLALRTWLGDDDLGAFELAEETLPLFDPAGLDADALVRTALEVNPEVLRSRLGVRTADVGVSEARSSWWPTLSLGLNVGRTAQTQEARALFDVSWDESLDSRFYAQISFPMFNDFFQNRTRQVQAAVELDNQRERDRETRLRIEETVRSALLELDTQWESLQLARRSADIAGEALRLAREEYRIGTRTFEDLQQAITSEADTRRQVIEARYSFV